MKALRWYGRRDARFEDAPEPAPGPGMLKIKVRLAGICGTDLKEYASGPILIPPGKAPLTMGHEFMGTVDAVGAGVKGFIKGDRVSGVGYYYCGTCYACKTGRYNLCLNQGFTGLMCDGCMAEYFVIPQYACYKLPGNVSDEMGSLVEPLAVALHAVKQAQIKKGDTAAVLGDGAIGLCAVAAAKAAGASRVYMIAKHRGRGGLAGKMGADGVLYAGKSDPVAELQKLTGGMGADACIECVGRPETPPLAVELVRRGGVAVLAGVFEAPGTIDFSTLTFTEKTLVGSSIYVDEGKTAIKLMAAGKIDPTPLISATVPLAEAVQRGFGALLEDKDNNVKVLLRVGE